MTFTLDQLGPLLDQAATPWAVIGGHAVNAWLEPRATADVDVAVAANPEGLGRMRALLEGAGLRIERAYGAAQPSGPDFVRFVSADGAFILELQTAKTPLQADLLKRAVRNGHLRVATPEDLLVLKLIAYRSKDQADLMGLVRLPALDWSYVEAHAAAWGVGDRLDRLRAAFL